MNYGYWLPQLYYTLNKPNLVHILEEPTNRQ